MAFVAKLKRDGYPVIAYQADLDGRPILDSVLVIMIPKKNTNSQSRVSLDGNYEFLRAELLSTENYDPKKTRLSIEEANRLRAYLRENYDLKGLEGDLS